MVRTLWLALAVAPLLGSHAAHANVCRAGGLTCATAMPVGGYCECTARGQTESGEVLGGPVSRRPANASAGGCGAHPDAPGCR